MYYYPYIPLLVTFLIFIVFLFYPGECPIDKKSYKLTPELSYFEEFEPCFGKNYSYCLIYSYLLPNESSKLWKYIDEFSKNKNHFRHDMLKRGLCMGNAQANIHKNEAHILLDKISNPFPLRLNIGIPISNNSWTSKIGEINTINQIHFCTTPLSEMQRTSKFFIMCYSVRNNFKKLIFTGIDVLDSIFWTTLIVTIVLITMRTFFVPKSSLSVKQSIKTLLETDNRMVLIDGIRTIAMQFVLVIHAFAQIYNLSLDNSLQTECSTHQKPLWIIRSLYLHISLIFILTGYLNYYTLYHKIRKGEKFSIPIMLIKRCIRFWPVLILTIIFSAGPSSKFFSHPRWLEATALDQQFCTKNWWATMFFLNNLYEPQNIVSQQF